MTIGHTRNFSIIAHIDHGKSTLADRFLEKTLTLSQNEMMEQVLDDMDLERERGITIKSHAVRMEYRAPDGDAYTLNLIDTPGHVDFSYEVSRSLAACEGALLLVDAAQGVEAQTVSNVLLALEHDLTIIPVVNKIDLPNAEISRVLHQLQDLLGVDESEILRISAKRGTGVEEVLQAIIERVPPPDGDPDAPLQALVFDSIYDQYRGVVTYLRVFQGTLNEGTSVRMFSTGADYEADEVGVLRLGRVKRGRLGPGDVGYLIAGIKDLDEAHVGDTVTGGDRPALSPLPGYKEVKPMVFAGLYPVNADDYTELRAALERLRLNDASLRYEPETSTALGFGFRCGFLGLLHMEIVQERLSREFGMDIITTVPNVEYEVLLTDGEIAAVHNPAGMPPPGRIDEIAEPILDAQILVPKEYVGNIMKLAQDRRGAYVTTDYVDPTRALLRYELPLSEIVLDFYDRLKSVSRGYASFDYEYKVHRPSDLVKLDILINGDPVDALSAIVHRDKAYQWGRALCLKLKELIPRQMFEVVIQASIGSRAIARESVRPFRKNVTAKCYGGDVTRKRKLLERQKEGKQRMKQVGNVEIPQEAFLAVLNMEA
ncbi:MAG: translation elongation factor 4 [Candidatus Latescibacteria bacterium]|jgi:GTP-binding protein LepA|nr:translation elongation factor 4 [Candidatus Latescibacterota bacterium]